MAVSLVGLDVNTDRNSIKLYTPRGVSPAISCTLQSYSEGGKVYKLNFKHFPGALLVNTDLDDKVNTVTYQVGKHFHPIPAGLHKLNAAELFIPAESEKERQIIYGGAEVTKSIFNPILARRIDRAHPEPHYQH